MIKKLLLFSVCSAFVYAVTGCSSKPVVSKEIRGTADEFDKTRESLKRSDQVAPGNTLIVRYDGDPKVSGQYQVDFDGKVHMPYDITLTVAGLSTGQVASKISAAYRPFVKGDHGSKVEIKDRNVWVEVHGEVKTPGRYLVRLDTPLEEVIAHAGGYLSEQTGPATSSTVTQRPEFLRIERARGPLSQERQSTWYELAGYYFQYDAEPAFLWRGGERLFFQKTVPADAAVTKNWHAVTVMGEVHDPKDLPVLPNADLMTYISRAGGTLTSADLNQVEIVHRTTGEKTTVDLTKAPLFNEIRAGDVITVRALDMRPTTFDKILNYTLTFSTITLSVVAIMLL